MRAFALVLFTVFLAGCAQSPGSIQATYVSPLLYQNYSCEQVRREMMRVGRKVQEVAGAQSKEATGDAVVTTVGLVVFWPALFFLMGGGDRAEELARLKGESEALEQAAIQKNCTALVEQIEREREHAKRKATADNQGE